MSTLLPGRKRATPGLTLSLLTLLVSLGGCLLLAGCERGAPAKVTKNPRVIVTKPVQTVVMDYQDFTGRLEAVKNVDIRARVSGYVNEVPFKEGDLVKEGSLLFQIDPRTYLADLNQAEANLRVAIAERNLQQENAKRARKLYANRTLATEDFDTILAADAKAVATVGALQAAKERAQLYVDFTRVIAPVSGRISRRYVDPGNLITADTTILTTIVTEDPMYAYFDVDERTYLESAAPGKNSYDVHAKKGQTPFPEGAHKLPVLMRLANESDFEKDKVGYIDFVDNHVVGTSGTMRMRGVFANPSGLLKAGLFVRIRLPIGAEYQATLIPDEAIQSDQERKYVWVLNAKNEVEYRSVQLGQAIHEWRVIKPPEKGKEGKEGLSLDDRLIVSGMQRVSKGKQVDPENQAPPPPPDVPLVRLLREAKGSNGERVTR